MTDRLLGCFRLGRELGAGGMGTVHAATVVDRCPGLDEGARVALKIVHPHLLEQPGFFRRFMREAEIGASVEHPNVVRTYLADALGAEHFLVMEYVEGQDLRGLLAELDRVPEELCRHVGREIAKGLAAIHAAGVVHRDLKPENVLITADHVVKVMDLGVARLQDEAVRLSQTGAFVGSLHYAAPEAFRDGGGADVDGRADLHALGLLLYELACGVNPYLADDVPQTLRKVLNEEPRRLGDINPQLSPFFEEVVHCLLAKDREQRFTSAGTLLSVLEDGEESKWWRERAKSLRASTNRPLRRIRIPRETAVYGREKELDRLRGMFEQAKSGDGQVVLIEGEAGIGKSRLVDELIGRLHADGEDLNFLFGSYPPGGASTASGGFSSAYREHFGESGSVSYLEQTPLLVPAYDAVLRGEPAPKEAVELTKDSLATCFVHATRNLAEERPTVVLVDDLHFAPEEARALFVSLALAVPGHRILLVGTMRPGVPEDWVANLSRLDHTTHVELSRLGPKDLALLLNESFHSEQLAHQLGVQIGLKSDGNPFFAFEIIRGLREGQFITQTDDGTWASTRVIDDIQIPSSVLDLVNARVADLSEEERDLLDVACCWGFEFDPALISDVTGVARIPLYKRLAQIERAHRLVRSSGRSFIFDHHQVQESLYASLPEVLREEYHGALADALEARTGAAEKAPEELDGALCVDLFTHFLDGGRGPSAIRYLERASAHLTESHLHAEAAGLTERALAVRGLASGAKRARFLMLLNRTLQPLGRRARQEECASELLRIAEGADDDFLRMRAWLMSGGVQVHTSRLDDAEVSLKRAIAMARDLDRIHEEAMATGNLATVYSARGQITPAREWFERAIEISRCAGLPNSEAVALGGLGVMLQQLGQIDEAESYLGRALAMSRDVADRAFEATCLSNLGFVAGSQGLFERSIELHRAGAELSSAIGERAGMARKLGGLGVAHFSMGRLSEARDYMQRELEMSRELGNRLGAATALGNLGVVLESLGRLDDAERLQRESLALSQELGYLAGVGYANLNIGGLALLRGDVEAARRALSDSLDLSRKHGHSHVMAEALLRMGRCQLLAGDRGSAATTLASATHTADEGGHRGVAVLARCLIAEVEPSRVAEACEAMDRDGPQLSLDERRDARLLLWKVTNDRVHLEDAKRLLDEALELVSNEYYESMCQNVPVNREILAAWREEFGDDDE